MKTDYIEIGDNKWGVIVLYDFGLLDMDYLASVMETFGMTDSNIRESMRVLYGVNGAMTISNLDVCMSVVFIGQTSCLEELINSIAHECDHIQSAILDYYDIPQGTEEAAYTQGYVVAQMVKSVVGISPHLDD